MKIKIRKDININKLDTNTRITKLFVFYFITLIIIVLFLSCDRDYEKSHKEVQMKNEKCSSVKLELLLRSLLKKSFLFPELQT